MGNAFILIISTIAGGLGSWAGSYYGMPMALFGGLVGSVIGIYYGWKWNQQLFDW